MYHTVIKVIAIRYKNILWITKINMEVINEEQFSSNISKKTLENIKGFKETGIAKSTLIPFIMSGMLI